MYAPEIVERRLAAEIRAGNAYTRRSREDCLDIASKLEKLRYDKSGKLLPNNDLSRPVDQKELAHIRSELVICKNDFKYYFERYHAVELDPGVLEDGASMKAKIAAPLMLQSQHRYVDLIGRREVECYAELKKYKFTEGVLAVFHKVRQVSATAWARGATMHRMLFWPGTRSFAASLDDKRVTELFHRDRDVTLEHLPWWMKPSLYPDVKDTEIGFGNGSICAYQAENQQQGRGGLGVGSQRDVSHLTEVGLWQNPEFISFSFLPSVPKAITTLHIEESTANGKGNYWHELTELVRHKKPGYESWVYAFIPWYMNTLKYRANVPDGWAPAEHTLAHATLIEKTSHEFFDGQTIRPNASQLYWWEKTRAQHAAKGELSSFLTNYPATPEQSFQNPSEGALPAELLEIMETETDMPVSFDMEVAA